jgi:hypothetical protein
VSLEDDFIEVTVACGSCRSTGLYRGFAEPDGVAVICLDCKGSGGQVIKFKKFTGRQERSDVREVYSSRGSFIATGVGPREDVEPMTYEQFLQEVPAIPQAT